MLCTVSHHVHKHGGDDSLALIPCFGAERRAKLWLSASILFGQYDMGMSGYRRKMAPEKQS